MPIKDKTSFEVNALKVIKLYYQLNVASGFIPTCTDLANASSFNRDRVKYILNALTGEQLTLKVKNNHNRALFTLTEKACLLIGGTHKKLSLIERPLPLTKKQLSVLSMWYQFVLKNGVSPTQKELKEIVGFKSNNTISGYLNTFTDKGVLVHQLGKARGYTITPLGKALLGFPIESDLPKNAFPDKSFISLWRSLPCKKQLLFLAFCRQLTEGEVFLSQLKQETLTEKQINFIRTWVNLKQKTSTDPTYVEMRDEMSVSSVNTISSYYDALIKKGVFQRRTVKSKSRTIALTKEADKYFNMIFALDNKKLTSRETVLAKLLCGLSPVHQEAIVKRIGKYTPELTSKIKPVTRT